MKQRRTRATFPHWSELVEISKKHNDRNPPEHVPSLRVQIFVTALCFLPGHAHTQRQRTQERAGHHGHLFDDQSFQGAQAIDAIIVDLGVRELVDAKRLLCTHLQGAVDGLATDHARCAVRGRNSELSTIVEDIAEQTT